MKALVLKEIAHPCLEEIDVPVLTAGEVLVSVKACGICGSDIPRIYHTGAHHMPLIPGHELAGVVVRVSQEQDTHWLGKRVGVFPLIPCKACPACLKKRYEMCEKYSYLGSRQNGGFAELVAVPAWNLIALPNEVSFEEAAMLEPMAVAAHAMRKVSFNPEDTVLIYGAGTIGALLAMLCMERGYKKLYVVGNKLFQKQLLLELGLPAGHYCDASKTDVVQWLYAQTDSQGANVVFECVGKVGPISDAIACAKWGGYLGLVGNPDQDILLLKDIYWRILRKQLTLSGSWNSSFTHENIDDWHYVLERLFNGRIHPGHLISHRVSLDGILSALEMMYQKIEPHSKVVVTIPYGRLG